MGDYVPGQSVQGRCPSCNRHSLFLGDGGYVTCGWIGQPSCPDPGAASDLLTDRTPDLLLQAQRQALIDAANDWTWGGWADTPRHADRVRDRMAASQYAGDWLRARAAALTEEASDG